MDSEAFASSDGQISGISSTRENCRSTVISSTARSAISRRSLTRDTPIPPRQTWAGAAPRASSWRWPSSACGSGTVSGAITLGDTAIPSRAAIDVQTDVQFCGGKARCSVRHTGFNLTDEKYHKVGSTFDRDRPDVGRIEVTKKDADTGALKTPTRRHIELTAP